MFQYHDVPSTDDLKCSIKGVQFNRIPCSSEDCASILINTFPGKPLLLCDINKTIVAI